MTFIDYKNRFIFSAITSCIPRDEDFCKPASRAAFVFSPAVIALGDDVDKRRLAGAQVSFASAALPSSTLTARRADTNHCSD